MSIDSIGYAPPLDKDGEEQNQELISRAEELVKKFQEMLKRNKGEYPPHGIYARHDQPSPEDEKIIEELEYFFEDDCKNITSMEVGQGGNSYRDELKKLSDTLWLFREVQAEFDIDVKEYSIIDKKKATELLQTIIEKRNRQIKVLEAQNQEAEKLLK